MKLLTIQDRFQPQGSITVRSDNQRRFLSAERSSSDRTKVYVQTYGSRGHDYDPYELKHWALRLINECDQVITERNADGLDLLGKG